MVRYTIEFDDRVVRCVGLELCLGLQCVSSLTGFPWCLQAFEINVGLKEDAMFYDLATGDRMYLHASSDDMVPFTPEEINDPLFNEIISLNSELS